MGPLLHFRVSKIPHPQCYYDVVKRKKQCQLMMHTEENQPSHKQIHASIATESFFVVCVSNLMFILYQKGCLLCVCGSTATKAVLGHLPNNNKIFPNANSISMHNTACPHRHQQPFKQPCAPPPKKKALEHKISCIELRMSIYHLSSILEHF